MDAQGLSSKRPHVVALPIPTRGHINPMMHLCKMLAAQGIFITVINSEHNDKLVADAEREALQRLGIRLEAIPDGLGPHVDRTAHLVEFLEIIFSAMPEPFEALLTRLFGQQPPPSCILGDLWLTFTVPAASKFGLPHASLWTQSAVSFTNLRMVANGSFRGPAQKEPCIQGAEFLKEEDLNTLTRGCVDQSDSMYRFVTGGFDQLDQSRWIFLNTFDELEDETLKALMEDLGHIHAIGPLLPSSLFTHNSKREAKAYHGQSDDLSSLWVEEKACLTWLNQFEPNSVLYVSFGSLALITSQQFEEIALGLEASGHPFLLVARPDLVHGGSLTLDEMFRERVKERACFVTWAPQLKVLSHKSVGGFFTHGGWNSTLEGISIGVPMLGWPYFSDQPMVCKCIEERWKLGLRLTKGGSDMLVSRGIIAAKVRELMGSPKFLNKACEWSNLAKKAALPGGSSFKKLQGFVETLKRQK